MMMDIMGEFIGVVVLLLFLVGGVGLLLLPFILLARIKNLENATSELADRLKKLEARRRESPPPESTPITVGKPEPIVMPPSPPPPPVPAISRVAEKMAAAREQAHVPPPPLVEKQEPPLAPPPPVQPPVLPQPAVPAINWEHFMGVKLFAWAGGFVLFLALIFFLRYAFEHKLISPPIQVAGEYALALALLGAGLWLRDKTYAVLSQTLCATSVVALYAVTFAARAYYQLFAVPMTFGLMIVVTVIAFLVAVRRDAIVVAVLGLVGGFLTPLLVRTGQDNPLGLFGYAALLDIGLIAMATRKRWGFLLPMAVAGTALLQVAWVSAFFVPAKFGTAMTVFLGFELLFVAGCVVYHGRQSDSLAVAGAAVAAGFVALAFGFYFLTFKELGDPPWRLVALILLADAGLLALALARPEMSPSHLAAGGIVFVWLALWTEMYLKDKFLYGTLATYVAFAAMHGIGPVLLTRFRQARTPSAWSQFFPLITLLLVLWPITRSLGSSVPIWTFVLVVDLLVMGLALVTGSILAVLGALVLTVLAMAVWIGQVPNDTSALTEILVVVGGFALVFYAAGIGLSRWLNRRISPGETGAELDGNSGSMQVQVPVAAAVMPFALLLMVVARLPLTDPTPVFGLAMGLVVMLLAVARWTREDWLSAVALGAVLILQFSWSERHFQAQTATAPLAWAVAFYAVITIFPFLFRQTMQDKVTAWAAAALAGPLHFVLIYDQFKAAHPNPYMGLLPAIMAVPALLALGHLAYWLPQELATRNSLLAWFGGSALFFITMIFPVQWSREWLTIGWALEGAALLWLRHRIPHRGLLLVGLGLLAVAFVRLALNPAVLAYHPRTGTPIWNWYLYAYGLVTCALMVGGKLAAIGQPTHDEQRASAVLYSMGTVLAFLLMNIEIADYYATGSTLTFEFHRNFGRDMTYSIGWALFALAMLVVGVLRRLKPVRVAAMALIVVTLGKLFLHDLAALGQLYRIGAFVGVAVVLLAASFLYQRFFAASSRPTPSDN